MLADLEIHWYFIAEDLKIDFLISPMKLLDQKVTYIKGTRMSFDTFYNK